MKQELVKSEPKNEIVVYLPNETMRLEVRVLDESVWLAQEQIAVLFGTRRPAITKHLAIFTRAVSWTRRPHVPFWNIWGRQAFNGTERSRTILTTFFLQDIASTVIKLLASVVGQVQC